MLRKLYIQNYAIIEELEVPFSNRMNAITGETGAGKSIIVGALGLVLGQRADTSVLLNRERKCIIEGIFDAEPRKEVMAFLKAQDLDQQEELVIRREIAANGKSRAFINDTPVNLNQLVTLSSLLVDLHQQFDTQDVAETVFQREVLDALAGNEKTLSEYRRSFGRWQSARLEYESLVEKKTQFDRDTDYNQFQYDELAEAAFRENELEETEQLLKTMTHAEGIKAALDKLRMSLNEGDSPIVQQLRMLYQQVSPFSGYHPQLPELLERLQSAHIELKDLGDETEQIAEQVQYDPQKVEELNDRLSTGYRLLKKHGVQTTDELLAIQRVLEEKLQSALDIDELIVQKEKESRHYLAEAEGIADKLSESRRAEAPRLDKKVNALLTQVGMPNARLRVTVTAGALNPHGKDHVEFLFDANKSGQFLPVRKVASGGELSRLMLCIKSLVAEMVNLPTLIFDEIDTGISGEAARQVGIIMKDLSQKRQVITITHQPQIAGKSDAHFLVYKEARGNTVRTGIRQLSKEERITAIARMLSGEKPTAAAIENAREMVSN